MAKRIPNKHSNPERVRRRCLGYCFVPLIRGEECAGLALEEVKPSLDEGLGAGPLCAPRS
jgi:hypothetical protein